MEDYTKEIKKSLDEYSKLDKKRAKGRVTEKEFSVKSQSITDNITRLLLLRREELNREREGLVFSLSDLEEKHASKLVDDEEYSESQRGLQERMFDLEARLKKIDDASKDLKLLLPEGQAPKVTRVSMIVIFIIILAISFYFSVLRLPTQEQYTVTAAGFSVLEPVKTKCALQEDYFECVFTKPASPIEVYGVWISNPDTLASCSGSKRVNGRLVEGQPILLEEQARNFTISANGCSNLGYQGGERRLSVRVYYNQASNGKKTEQISKGEIFIRQN
ncbi:MAG: hypothetical protein V1921_08610 [Candidatus Altiarchaeota archaeon]